MARAERQPKKRSRGSVLTKLLILVILAAIGLQLRSLHSQVQDASYTQVPDEETAEASAVPEAEPVAHQFETSPQQENMAPAEVDEELNRFVNMFKLLRETGYTLRIIPGTPEENAPVFDFGQEQIIRKAA